MDFQVSEEPYRKAPYRKAGLQQRLSFADRRFSWVNKNFLYGLSSSTSNDVDIVFDLLNRLDRELC